MKPLFLAAAGCLLCCAPLMWPLIAGASATVAVAVSAESLCLALASAGLAALVLWRWRASRPGANCDLRPKP